MSQDPLLPPRDGIYSAIIWVLVASIVLGAAMMIGAETVVGDAAFAAALRQVGLGIALVCGAIYFVFRWLERREARRRADAGRDSSPPR